MIRSIKKGKIGMPQIVRPGRGRGRWQYFKKAKPATAFVESPLCARICAEDWA